MDLNVAEAAVSAAVGALTALAGLIILAYRFGSRLTAIESQATSAQLAAAEAKQKANENKTDIDTLTKEQGESWQELYRTLGNIEGELGMNPPTRPRGRSRP